MLLTAEASATLSLNATSPGDLGSVVLPRGGSVRVEVPGLAEAGGVVTLTGPRGMPHRSIGRGGQVSGQWTLRGGWVMVSNLEPGRWMVRVTAPDGGSWDADVVLQAGMIAETIVEIP